MLEDLCRRLSTSHFSTSRKMPIAAWEIGGCVQHRQIYCVLTHNSDGNGASPASWTIFDYNGPGERNGSFESLKELLEHEIDRVKERPGGAQIELVIPEYARYPQ
jgi:hypothetical protein